jgi:hypothetical protein
MNGIQPMKFAAGRLNGLVKWPLLCTLLFLVLARTALATDPIWPPAGEIGQVFNYTVPGTPPPNIDATTFDNENQFTINFTAATANPEIFETWNTINYTNNGLMIANAPLSTNGIFLTIAPGCGYLFDTQTTNVIDHQMAGTFYNPGTIRVNSVTDNSDDFFFLLTAGELTVDATNIINPGIVTLGEDGLMQFTGQSVDLTRSQLNVENLNTLYNVLSNSFPGVTFEIPLNYNVLAALVGHETNYIDPFINFALPNPASDDFLPPLYLGLKNATAYVQTTAIFTNLNLVRAVFISNPIPSVTNNVYFNTSFGFGFFDDILVGWTGSYVNPATGVQTTDNMYLEDDFGEITNLQVIVDPVNYFWFQNEPFFLGPPAPSGLPFGTFNNSFITNDFAYESVQMIGTSVATNASLSNPSGALSNLLGRIQVNASHDLNLNLAQIAGASYMSLTATNQFNGSQNAAIFSPYSDISLGVTNGFLSVSNLLEPSVPNWNGPIQVFSARWTTVDAFGNTNIYHVLLVNSDVQATTTPEVQNLTLHATNLVVSDTFNVFGKLSIDATNLTLTQNLNTGGVGSQDGELNLQSVPIVWANSVPNVRNLTNNGAIRTLNIASFGSSQSPYYNFISTGLIMDAGAQIWAGNFNCSGTFSNVFSASAPFTLQQSTNAVLTNLVLSAGGDVSISTSTLVASNVVLSAGRSLTLVATNLVTDQIPSGPTTLTNGNIWTVGATAINNGKGLSLPLNPTNGDLLGTTITNIAPSNVQYNFTWAGNDYGATTAGFSNNAAIGRLILNGLSSSAGPEFVFSGTGVSNAMYVDYLEFDGTATNESSYNFSKLKINSNMVVYFAQAFMNGNSVAEKIDQASRFNGQNNGRLIWVPSYSGHFSYTNIVSGGVTNAVNAALASSPDIDSNGNGVNNASDPSPFFLASQLHFTEALTNVPPLSVKLTWATIPLATNYVYYRTNLLSTNWMQITNFTFASTNLPITNATFASSNYPVRLAYPGFVLTNYPSPATNISVLDPVNLTQPRYYRVVVQPWLTGPNGY